MGIEVLMCYFLHAFSQGSLFALSRTICQWSDAVVERILVGSVVATAGKGHISGMLDVPAWRYELDLRVAAGPQVCGGRDQFSGCAVAVEITQGLAFVQEGRFPQLDLFGPLDGQLEMVRALHPVPINKLYEKNRKSSSAPKMNTFLTHISLYSIYLLSICVNGSFGGSLCLTDF
jgi:hypothetical protein